MKRLKRHEVIPEHQTEFSPLLFDVLFGLLLFQSISWFFSLKDAVHFSFFALSLLIVIHWWLKYKSEEEVYGLDANNSTLDLLFGVAEVIMLEAAMLAATQADYLTAVFFFTLPLVTEAVWALLWRLFGTWRRSSKQKVAFMERLLERTMLLDLSFAAIIGGVLTAGISVTAGQFVAIFAAIYFLYIALTFFFEMVGLKIF
jgi:hypothetical protein